MPFDLSTGNAVEYLQSRGLTCESPRITELGGGISNTVVLIESADQRFVLKQSLAKLRVQEDWFSDRARIFRECSAIRWLGRHLPRGNVPEVHFEDRENFLFMMSAADRQARNWKALLMSGQVDTSVGGTVGRMLAQIVSASWRDADSEREFGDQTVFSELRLAPYYRATASRHPDLAPHFARVMEDTSRRRVSLVHGDWSPKNFLVNGPDVMAIDFEVIHFGDPSFDAAFLLNHMLLKSFYLPELKERLASAALAFWRVYREGLPADCEWIERATLAHLGCLLLARIDGKSPAEYLCDPALRERVRDFARRLITHPPSAVAGVFVRAQRGVA